MWGEQGATAGAIKEKDRRAMQSRQNYTKQKYFEM